MLTPKMELLIKNMYFYWSVIIFFFLLRKVPSTANCSVFDCFIFYNYSKKTRKNFYIFNCAVISVFSLKGFFTLLIILSSLLNFFLFFLCLRGCSLPLKFCIGFLLSIWLSLSFYRHISVVKKLYFVFFKILKFYIVFKKFLSDFQTIYKFFFLHTKTSKDLCARNYQKKQNKIQKKSREKYQNLIE